jgi:hypothetical protein
MFIGSQLMLPAAAVPEQLLISLDALLAPAVRCACELHLLLLNRGRGDLIIVVVGPDVGN